MISSDLAQRQHLLPEQYPWKLNTVTRVSHIFPVNVICRCQNEVSPGPPSEMELPETADRLLISHPRKRKVAHRPARPLITRMNATFPKKTKSAWKISLAKRFELMVYLVTWWKGIIPPPPKQCSPILTHVIFIMTQGCGLWIQAMKTFSRIFWLGIETPMWSCISLHVASEWWRQAWTFWSLLDSALSSHPAFTNWRDAT